MALGDGDTIDYTVPTNTNYGYQIDDYIRHDLKAIGYRLAHEHEFPDSQSATSEGGKHKFITMQNQATKPTVSGTQVVAVYCKSTGTDYGLYFENNAGVEVPIVVGTSVNAAPPDGTYIITSGTAINLGIIFGTYVSATASVAYTATNDIIVMAWASTPDMAVPIAGHIFGYVDTSADPSTLKQVNGVAYGGVGGSHTLQAGINFPVKKGENWKVTHNGDFNSPTVQFLTIGH